MGRLCTHGNKGSVARRRASMARRRRARASEPDADGVDAPSTASTHRRPRERDRSVSSFSIVRACFSRAVRASAAG